MCETRRFGGSDAWPCDENGSPRGAIRRRDQPKSRPSP